MTGVILANLLRRPGRTLLTALGTALGVATIVALLAVTDGLRQTAGQLVHLGRADLGLFQSDAADPTTSVLPLSLIPRLRATPGVADAVPILLLSEAVPGDPAALVFGSPPDGFLRQRLVLSAGRQPSGPGEIAIGDRLAAELHLRPGATTKISGHRERVVGIYHSGVPFEDEGVMMGLKEAQRIGGRPQEATTIAVQLSPNASPSAMKQRLKQRFPGLVAISEPSEALRTGVNGQLISQAATVIVVLALIIGGIAVMNTMLLATLERRGDFAIMAAVGWSSPQVAGLVLAESLATGLIGAGIGLGLGAASAGPLVSALGAADYVHPQLSGWGFGQGLLVGGAIGVVGGLYPAWRVTRLRPAAVLASR